MELFLIFTQGNRVHLKQYLKIIRYKQKVGMQRNHTLSKAWAVKTKSAETFLNISKVHPQT